MRDGVAQRRMWGQLRAHVHAAAQSVRRHQLRAESMLPLAEATEQECAAALQIAHTALSANRVLRGGVVPSHKAVPGRFVPSVRPTAAMRDGQREELRHALRGLAAWAEAVVVRVWRLRLARHVR